MGMHSNYDVILSPVITEKSTLLLEQGNQVIFKVAPQATKPEIKKAVEDLFKVKVKAVNTIVRKGKLKSFRGIRALQSDTKKAIVTLEPGHSIDISSGI
jgi:large subunit ribosomal protein L23